MIEPSELLAKIVLCNGVQPCPTKTQYYGEWVECLVAISPDHTAQIRMQVDDLRKLVGDYDAEVLML